MRLKYLFFIFFNVFFAYPTIASALGVAVVPDQLLFDGNENYIEHVVTTSLNNASSFCVIDMDNDNDSDIISFSSEDYETVWYENDGNQNFTEHFISTSSADAYGVNSVIAVDIDGDNDIDVIASNGYGNEIVYF